MSKRMSRGFFRQRFVTGNALPTRTNIHIVLLGDGSASPVWVSKNNLPTPEVGLSLRCKSVFTLFSRRGVKSWVQKLLCLPYSVGGCGDTGTGAAAARIRQRWRAEIEELARIVAQKLLDHLRCELVILLRHATLTGILRLLRVQLKRSSVETPKLHFPHPVGLRLPLPRLLLEYAQIGLLRVQAQTCQGRRRRRVPRLTLPPLLLLPLPLSSSSSLSSLSLLLLLRLQVPSVELGTQSRRQHLGVGTLGCVGIVWEIGASSHPAHQPSCFVISVGCVLRCLECP